METNLKISLTVLLLSVFTGCPPEANGQTPSISKGSLLWTVISSYHWLTAKQHDAYGTAGTGAKPVTE